MTNTAKPLKPLSPSKTGTWVGIAGPGVEGLAIDPTKPVIVVKMTK